MNVLVIDSRNRDLSVFVASATKTGFDKQTQLVLRHALDMGFSLELLQAEKVNIGRGKTVVRRYLTVPMPILLMGEYSARSSAGRVALLQEGGSLCHRVQVVGGLGEPFGKGGLKVLGRPINGVLIEGPVEVKVVTGADNSNPATATAAVEGARILAAADPTSAFLVEGQSDRTKVVRFRSIAPAGASAEIPVEHREAMFSQENIVRKIFLSMVYHGLARNCGPDEKPSDEDVREEVMNLAERYWLSRDRRCLGLGASSLIVSEEVVERVAEGYVPRSSVFPPPPPQEEVSDDIA